jgi:hypothetical protein
VEFFVDASETVAVHMGVNLCGADVGVAEHFLEAAEVHAAGEKVGRKAVPEGVDSQAFGHAGPQSIFFYNPPEVNPVDGFSSAG